MEAERLAVVENELKNVRSETKDIKNLVTRMDEKADMKFDNLTKIVASKSEVENVNDRIDKEVLPEIREIKGKKQLKENLLWITIICSAILNVVMVYQVFSD